MEADFYKTCPFLLATCAFVPVWGTVGSDFCGSVALVAAICGYFVTIVLTGALPVAVDVLLDSLVTFAVMFPNAVLPAGAVGFDHEPSLFLVNAVG